ncbi:MAG: hypothetical protein R3B13_28760 [Polyangiaceae bacterium]
MSVLRSTTAALWAFGYAYFVVQAAGCGTDATGVDECRDIEAARCEAAAFCGIVDDVEQCKRFYRDQCLHGLASGEQPGAPRVKECIATLHAAGTCAKEGKTALSECGAPVSGKTIHSKVCDVILHPEGAAECDFLASPVEVPDASPEASLDAATDTGAGGASSDATAD